MIWKALAQTQPRTNADVMAEIKADMALDAANSGVRVHQAG
jgi:hypothetical protein